MPQLQNLVLTDRATTPIAHTFVPRDIRDNIGTVVESSGIPIGDNRFTISSVRTPQGKSKARVQLTVPVVQTQTINGVSTPVVVRTAYVDATFTFDATSTEQERKDLFAYISNLLGTAAVKTAAIAIEPFY
jgi:hypothetical protein